MKYTSAFPIFCWYSIQIILNILCFLTPPNYMLIYCVFAKIIKILNYSNYNEIPIKNLFLFYVTLQIMLLTKNNPIFDALP